MADSEAPNKQGKRRNRKNKGPRQPESDQLKPSVGSSSSGSAPSMQSGPESNAPKSESKISVGQDSISGQGQQTKRLQVQDAQVLKGRQQGQCPKGAVTQEDNKPDGEVKTKAQLKAERRAKQEAQRAAKAAAAGGGTTAKKEAQVKEIPRVPDSMRADDERMRKTFEKKMKRQQVPTRSSVLRKVGLFSHLHQYEREISLTAGIQFSAAGIHPAVLQLGLQYAEGLICGSNARCIALLGALKQVIADYTTPPDKELARDLDAKLKPYITFLDQCRPKSVSMGNAIKYIKWHINRIPQDMPDTQAKKELADVLNTYLYEKIQLAGEAISKTFASTKIKDGDVIMVYACSSLIQKVLKDAHDMKRRFQVVVVDGRPKLEGREMLRRLVKYGIRCRYVLINAASHVFPEVTKVLLGAHTLLANGYVMSRVGSSQMALLAKAYNVPVLVCCETYKFCERVQTDSFVFNELGDPNDVAQVDKAATHLQDWKDQTSLSVLNLVYDVTPPELVTMVITEIGMVPCTSVPVVLRVKQVEGDSQRDI